MGKLGDSNPGLNTHPKITKEQNNGSKKKK
jgi:hypothetical protein